jgi:hypothetical protein
MHAENYGAIWKHEWINCASSLILIDMLPPLLVGWDIQFYKSWCNLTVWGKPLVAIGCWQSSLNHSRELFSNVLNDNAAILSEEDKFVWILSNEDPSCVRELVKLFLILYLNLKYFIKESSIIEH